MYYSDDPEKFVTACFTSIIVILVVLAELIIVIISVYKHYNENENTVVDSTIEYVDSIKKENDKLIIEVNNLDSIKNAEIIEVKNLDNDSTIKLFYKLIRE